MSAAGDKRGRGRPPKGDEQPSAKKVKEGTVVLKDATIGRPKKTLAEKNPAANSLMQTVIGLIDGVKSGYNTGDCIPEERFTNVLKKHITNTDKDTAVFLHRFMVEKIGDREEIIEQKKTELHKEKRRAKFTDAQKQFTSSFKNMDKPQAEQMKQFFILCLKDLEFLTLTSEKITPQLEVERLFCLAMDSMNDRKSSSIRALPQGDTQDSDAYGEDFSDDDNDGDAPAGKKRGGSDDDTVADGY